MIVWALDLATRTGECWGEPGALPALDHHTLPSTGHDNGTFLAAYRTWFLRRAAEIKPTFIAFEAPFAKTDGAARKLFGLANVTELCCFDLQIPCGEAPPRMVKKALTGSGNAKKPAMVAAARRYGLDPFTYILNGQEASDEADAFGVWITTVRARFPEHAARWAPLGPLFGAAA